MEKPPDEEDSVLRERTMQLQLDQLDSSFVHAVEPANVDLSSVGHSHLIKSAQANSSNAQGSNSDTGLMHNDAFPRGDGPTAHDHEQGHHDEGLKPQEPEDSPIRQPSLPESRHSSAHSARNFRISALETMSSSPTAAAAARTVSRIVSQVSDNTSQGSVVPSQSHDDSRPFSPPQPRTASKEPAQVRLVSSVFSDAQTDGTVPTGRNRRSTSLGSLASGVGSEMLEPQTPGSTPDGLPTDTVIAQHVKDVEVPATLARQYKAASAAPRQGNLTLKEQSTTIDRLMKDNWNLKLKITFLDEVLNRTSDDNIKAILSENVELRTAKFQSAKDIRDLRRTIRDLERRLQESSYEQEIERWREEAYESKRKLEQMSNSGPNVWKSMYEEEVRRRQTDPNDQETAELRKEVGAQTSMLASRNRERDRLQQELEELRLQQNSNEVHDLRQEISTLTQQAEQALEELEQLDQLRTDHERLQELYDNDLTLATEDLQTLQRERDEALRHQEELEADMQDMKAEGNEKIASLEHEVEIRAAEATQLRAQHALNSEALRREVRALSENVQTELDQKVARIKDLQLELDLLGQEADVLDRDLREANAKLESFQREIAFLREEQDADKMKQSELQEALDGKELQLDNLQSTGQSEKNELQKVVCRLEENAAKTQNTLVEKEKELTTLHQLKDELQAMFPRQSVIMATGQMQKDLQRTVQELDGVRHELVEAEQALQSRDALLESHSLETRKLSDLLDRERQSRRGEKSAQSAAHEQTSRAIATKEARIHELESRHSKRVASLERQWKTQVHERHQLLLDVWKRVTPLCGPEWSSLVNNHVPTAEIIGKESMYGPFSRNLVLAIKHVEGVLEAMQERLKTREAEGSDERNTMENLLQSKTKQVEDLEASIHAQRVSETFNAAPEIAKLRGENRLLKSELAALHKQELAARRARQLEESPDLQAAPSPPVLTRPQSSSAVDGHSLSLSLQRLSPVRRFSKTIAEDHEAPEGRKSSTDSTGSDQRWIHRLKELERRLRAEREARLLDRSGARKRLEEGVEENRKLRAELDRERVRREIT